MLCKPCCKGFSSFLDSAPYLKLVEETGIGCSIGQSNVADYRQIGRNGVPRALVNVIAIAKFETLVARRFI